MAVRQKQQKHKRRWEREKLQEALPALLLLGETLETLAKTHPRIHREIIAKMIANLAYREKLKQ